MLTPDTLRRHSMFMEAPLTRQDSFQAPSEADALNDRQPLCFVPARPSGPEVTSIDAAAATHGRPSVVALAQAQPRPTATKKQTVPTEPKLPNPLRQLTPADIQMMQKPTSVLEYFDDDVNYRNIQVTQDLMKLVFIKRQDQARFDAHQADPKRPFDMLDRAVILADITTFDFGFDKLPRNIGQQLQKQKEFLEFVAFVEYLPVQERRLMRRYFAFFDKTEFQQWTKVFRELLQVVVQYYQINPNPVGVNRLWILSRSGEGNLTKDEMFYILDHHAQIKIKETVFDRLFQIVDDNRQGFLDRYGFETLYNILMKSETADRLWKKYAGSVDSPVMQHDSFLKFLKEEQREEKVTKEEARLRMFTMYSVTKKYKAGKDGPKAFDKEMFTMFICQSSLNYAGDEQLILHRAQPMDQPLNQYFIHSVNLTVVPEEYVDLQPFYDRLDLDHMVNYCLEIGVRCICLRVQSTPGRKAKVNFYFSADGVPSKLELKGFFHKLVDKAFTFTEYPLWLNFQICSLPEDQIGAFVEELEASLQNEYVSHLSPKHSPDDLQKKFIIIFTFFRDKELGRDTKRLLRKVSCFDVIKDASMSFKALMAKIQDERAADGMNDVESSSARSQRSQRTSASTSRRNRQQQMTPIAGVLLDPPTSGGNTYDWMRPVQPDYTTGPVLENLYDARAKLHSLEPRENRWDSTEYIRTLRAVSAIIVTRSVVRYEGGDPPSIRLPYTNLEQRLYKGDMDVSAKVYRLFFRSKEADDETPKDFETARYPCTMFTRLLSHGIQLVEYAPFSPTLDRQVAMAFFRSNRSCGYVLKPWSMRHMDLMGDKHPYHPAFMKPKGEDAHERKETKNVHHTQHAGITEAPEKKEDKLDADDKSNAADDAGPERNIGDDDGLEPRERCGNATLYIRVISGANLMLMRDDHKHRKGIGSAKEKLAKRTGAAPTNPYVIVRLDGEDSDSKQEHTAVVQGNGLAPVWNAMFEFEIHHRETAILSFLVYHDEGTHMPNTVDSFIGGFSIPVVLLKKGHRVIPLADQWGDRITTCPTLLCRIEELPSGNLLQVSANINKLKKQISLERQRLENRKKELLKENDTLRQRSLETQKQQQLHDELQAKREDMEHRLCHFGLKEGTTCAVS